MSRKMYAKKGSSDSIKNTLQKSLSNQSIMIDRYMNNLKKLQQSIGKIPNLPQGNSDSMPKTESMDSFDFEQDVNQGTLHLDDFSDLISAAAKSYQVKLTK